MGVVFFSIYGMVTWQSTRTAITQVKLTFAIYNRHTRLLDNLGEFAEMPHKLYHKVLVSMCLIEPNQPLVECHVISEGKNK
jgi:hypothetical protein